MRHTVDLHTFSLSVYLDIPKTKTFCERCKTKRETTEQIAPQEQAEQTFCVIVTRPPILHMQIDGLISKSTERNTGI